MPVAWDCFHRIRLFSLHQLDGSSEKGLNYHQSVAGRRKTLRGDPRPMTEA